MCHVQRTHEATSSCGADRYALLSRSKAKPFACDIHHGMSTSRASRFSPATPCHGSKILHPLMSSDLCLCTAPCCLSFHSHLYRALGLCCALGAVVLSSYAIRLPQSVATRVLFALYTLTRLIALLHCLSCLHHRAVPLSPLTRACTAVQGPNGRRGWRRRHSVARSALLLYAPWSAGWHVSSKVVEPSDLSAPSVYHRPTF